MLAISLITLALLATDLTVDILTSQRVDVSARDQALLVDHPLDGETLGWVKTAAWPFEPATCQGALPPYEGVEIRIDEEEICAELHAYQVMRTLDDPPALGSSDLELKSDNRSLTLKLPMGNYEKVAECKDDGKGFWVHAFTTTVCGKNQGVIHEKTRELEARVDKGMVQLKAGHWAFRDFVGEPPEDEDAVEVELEEGVVKEAPEAATETEETPASEEAPATEEKSD